MTTWIIEPRDPLIVRDGRPFGPDPGARATTLPFPFPSTTTGGVRTLAGRAADGIFDRSRIPQVMKIGVRGPLLVRLKNGDVTEAVAVEEWFAPAPADALLLEQSSTDTSRAKIKRLVPLSVPQGKTNLPNNLAPVGQAGKYDPAKPLPDAPRFWCSKQFEQWLRDGTTSTNELSKLGLGALPTDERMHVSIQSSTQTAMEGFLFQTRGLEFRTAARDHKLGVVEQLALAVLIDGDMGQFTGGMAPLGGERRLMHWQKSDWAPTDCPDEIRNQIAHSGYCRLVLLTSACFAKGFQPTELLNKHEPSGITPKLRAVALPRLQVVSGWDLLYGAPKPTRRLAPAGAVYFLELDGTEAQRRQWVDDHWMQCVSDDPQDCRDGFGLAVLGTWSGKLEQMEV